MTSGDPPCWRAHFVGHGFKSGLGGGSRPENSAYLSRLAFVLSHRRSHALQQMLTTGFGEGFADPMQTLDCAEAAALQCPTQHLSTSAMPCFHQHLSRSNRLAVSWVTMGPGQRCLSTLAHLLSNLTSLSPRPARTYGLSTGTCAIRPLTTL